MIYIVEKIWAVWDNEIISITTDKDKAIAILTNYQFKPYDTYGRIMEYEDGAIYNGKQPIEVFRREFHAG